MKFILLLLSFCFLTNLSAQSKLNEALRVFINDPDLKQSNIGVTIMDVETGGVIAAHRPDHSLIPASSLKTVSTAAALSILGDEYRYKTELEYSGQIDSTGTLHGDLYIKGYGDPTLGSEWLEAADDMPTVLQKFTNAVKKAGIKKIKGHIIGDGSYFSSDPVASSWQWEDMGNYYGAGAFGLNFHDNWMWLDFEQHPTLDSLPRVLGTRPNVPLIYAESLVSSAPRNTGDNAYIYGAPFRHHVTIRGTIPVGNKTTFSIKGSIPDPVLFTAYHLMTSLNAAGIEVEKSPRAIFYSSQDNRKVIYTHLSPSLKEIVWIANHESINLYCEVLLKTLGLILNKTDDYSNATDVLEKYWQSRGIDTEGMSLRDGSGLSAKNLITTRQMAKILKSMYKDKKSFGSFYNSLSTGNEGTLKGMFKSSPLALSNIRAKSGSLSNVRSYTGYARTKQGKLICFSMIANNFTCKSSKIRKKMEKLMISLCE